MIDLEVAQRNIERLSSYARQHSLAVRPHTKTHKSLVIARRQLDSGATGLTVAKAGEAEVMAAVSDDLLVAYPVLDVHRANRIAKLASDRILRVGVDSGMAVDALGSAARRAGSTVGILVDLDIGFGRTGVQSPHGALGLAQHVDGAGGVRLDGIMCYPGHVGARAAEEGQALGKADELLSETIALWASHGLEAGIVSGGSTPTAYQSHRMTTLTEIRPGTYVYYDRNALLAGCCTLDDCAARIVCTVISDAVPGKVVIDAGSKSLSSDHLAGGEGKGGFGHVVSYPEATIVRLTEEHGEIDVSRSKRAPTLGQRLQIVPNHVCTCVNLHDVAWLRANGEGLAELRIDARGRTI